MTPLARAASSRVEMVVIGGSTGAMECLDVLLRELIIPVAIVVVLHVGENQAGVMPRLFSARCSMPTVEPCDKERIELGTIYFAPAGYHLMVETDGHFALGVGPRVCNCRPSVDVMLESASEAYQTRLATIVLSGANSDGALGAGMVARRGGIVLVQDPATAQAKQMPSAALTTAPVDFVGSLQQIRNRLEEMGPSHERLAVAQHSGSR